MAEQNAPDFSDTRALLERADKHLKEFETLVAANRLFRLNEEYDRNAVEWVWNLKIDKTSLTTAKPVMSDCASNLSSALDHIASAAAKSINNKRNRKVHFPFHVDDKSFEATLRGQRKYLGNSISDMIEAARDRQKLFLLHMGAVKEIANSGKHWELLLSHSSPVAVCFELPGPDQKIFNLPATDFGQRTDVEFYRNAQRLTPTKSYIVAKYYLEGLATELVTTPENIFRGAFNFVRGTLDAMQST